MQYEKVKSNKTGYFLDVNGYKFRSKRVDRKTGIEYYQCVENGCKLSVKLDTKTSKLYNLGRFQSSKDYPTHNHPNHLSNILTSKFRKDIKISIKSNLNSTVRSFYNHTLNQNMENFEHLPTFDLVKSGLIKFKNKELPKNPQNLNDLEFINDQFVFLPNNQQFLQINHSINRDERIICFFTHKFLTHLCNSKIIFVDGTFKKTPPLFHQLFIMHFIYEGKVVPAIYCLLSRKSKETYLKLFELIENHSNMFDLVFNPEELSCDFESGLVSCIREKFPQTVVKGCLFHKNQNIFKHIKSNGLGDIYNTNEFFRTTIRKLNSLPLLPINLIEQAYVDIKDQLNQFRDHLDEIRSFLNYYEQTWLNQDALYPRELWNKYRDHKRTNNDPEGINNKINSMINQDHPNIYVLIKTLMDVQIDYEMQIREIDNGLVLNDKKTKYKEINKKLNNLWNDLDDEKVSVDSFLTKTQYLLSKNYNNF